ncbi:MAG: hypothetical protein KGL63_15110 [Betaproteobacteria bacterium]|nr:hypothetical protein [Betaproteobacteria bacterium]
MSVTLTDYGNVSVNTIAQSSVSFNPSLFSVTAWTPNEIDLSVNSSSGAHVLKLTGQFDLASVGSTPGTLADFINDTALGTVSSFTNYVNGALGFTENFGSISFSDLLSLLGANGTSAQSTALNSVFSGNDVYHTSNDASGTNSVTVNLYGGNNTFYENHPLLQSHDVFYGGSNTGINTVVLPGNASNYLITANPAYDAYTGTSVLSGYTITDKTGATNTLDVSQVERLQFADTKVALDVNGNAGEVAKILGAVFGPSSIQSHPDYVGLGLKYLDGGMSYADLSALALTAAGATTPQAIVNLLYTHVVGVAPTATQAAPFIQDLTSNQFSVGNLAVMAENTSLNTTHINLVGLEQTGIHYV